MRSKVLVTLTVLMFSLSTLAQVRPAAERNQLSLSAGAGMNFWWGDWGGAIHRLGPSAWVTADLWHGVGVTVEGHGMDIGGADPSSYFKYYVGEAGATYTYHHWKKIRPYAKAEIGYASLSFPSTGLPYAHQNERTWSAGGGVEYRTWKRLWTRVDYEYDFFPNFYSPITGQFHTLNPKGFTFGESYHFR